MLSLILTICSVNSPRFIRYQYFPRLKRHRISSILSLWSAMLSTSEIRTKVRNFLDGDVPLQALADCSASYSWNIHKRTTDEGTQALAYAVRAAVVGHEAGDIDDQEMRSELESAIGSYSLQPIAEFVSLGDKNWRSHS